MSDEIEGNSIKHGKILGGISLSFPALILPERNIQLPVQIIFNAPVGRVFKVQFPFSKKQLILRL
jgi:hypothetical protein